MYANKQQHLIIADFIRRYILYTMNTIFLQYFEH